MNAVTGWAAALCTAAVGCTALHMLAPKGGLGKLLRLLTAAFFLCCMVSPLLELKNITPLSLDTLPAEVSAEALQERVNAQFERQVTAALEQVARQTLENYSLEPAKVAIKMDTDENGGIYITKIILYLDKQNAGGAIAAKQVMEQRLGVEVDVAVLEE
ncbi:MAG TPA: stage III sporulation protein AF [Firmicutes bacterium]|nr:stage III sporulation protein AF [Bacillota bacterium]